jgi:hypothetical protein
MASFSHNRYDSGSDLKEEVVPQVDPSHVVWPADGMHVHTDLSPDDIAGCVRSANEYIF